MMRRIGILLLSALAFAGCDKTKLYAYEVGSAAFINASPGVSGITPEPGLFIYVDTVMRTASVIPYKGNTSYLNISPGDRKIEVRSSVNSLTKFVDLPHENIVSKTGYTYLIYDTLSVANPKLKVLKLKDSLVIPAPGIIKYRFLNAAVNSTPIDVTFLRISITPNDSITLANQPYIGATPNAASYSTFDKDLVTGTYVIKLKSTGTQNLLSTDTINLNGNIYTFFATGTAKGLPISAGAYKHYP